MSVATLFKNHPLRAAQPKLVLRTSKQLDGAAYDSQRNSKKVCIDDEVKKSLDTIERVVDNYSALQENIHALQKTIETTDQELSEEKAANAKHDRELAQAQAKINELQRLLSVEQSRLQETQTTVAAMAKVIEALETENSETRSHAMRLVQGVEILMAAENSIHLGEDVSRFR